MVNQMFKVFFSFLVLILLILVLYYVNFRSKVTFIKLPESLPHSEAVLSSPESLPHNETVLSSPHHNKAVLSSSYKCIAGPSTCNNEGRYRSKSVQVLKSIYISVRTAIKSHRSRLAPLLVTWLRTISPDQVSIKR